MGGLGGGGTGIKPLLKQKAHSLSWLPEVTLILVYLDKTQRIVWSRAFWFALPFRWTGIRNKVGFTKQAHHCTVQNVDLQKSVAKNGLIGLCSRFAHPTPLGGRIFLNFSIKIKKRRESFFCELDTKI